MRQQLLIIRFLRKQTRLKTCVKRGADMSAKPLKVFEYTAVVWKETEGYVSKCSELGVASCGDSFDHAVSNLREAVELYLDNAKALDL